MDKRDVLRRLDRLHYDYILREAGLSEATDGMPYSLGMRHGIIACREQLERIRAAIDHIDEPSEVTEVCPSCEREITLLWDTEQDGYKAYCPYCGERLMLCTACHDDGRDPADRTAFGKCLGCDYKSDADSCIHNPKIADEEGNEK